jgi:two-component system response regulator HydG
MDQEYGQYWQTIVETMEDGLLVVAPDGIIISVNPALERMLGFAKGQLLGKSCTALGCDKCSGIREMGGKQHCALFSKGGIRRGRCSLTRQDGSKIPVIKNAALLRDPKGQVIGGVETLTDLSAVAAKEQELEDLRRKTGVANSFQGILGISPVMQNLYELIRAAAQSDAPVLILGESGTGKELVAEAIHNLSSREGKPFIKVNCAALNESLLESELFGHVKGAFTGADRTRMGRFQAAQEGSFFLDEVGDLPPSTQVKLLRVLQERQIERVGDHQPIKVDVRFIAATHRNLRAMVEEGGFRQDLFFRVAVIPIEVPPLRERKADIPLLADVFTERLRQRTGRNIQGVGRDALELLEAYSWPGNVRELINVMEYSFVVCKSGQIQPDHLPREIQNGPATPTMVRTRKPGGLNRSDHAAIKRALDQAGGNRSQAARLLGISRVTLWKWLKNMEQEKNPAKR